MLLYIKETKKSILKTKKTNHFFRLNRRIDKDLTLEFEKFCSKVPEDTSHIVYLLFNSKGGDLGEASNIIELRNTLVNTVVCLSYEEVHSSAIPIFASGDIRIARNIEGTFFFHNAKKVNLEISDEIFKKSELSIFSYLADRMSVSSKLVRKLATNSTYVSSINAQKLGLVQKIIPIKSFA